MHRRGRARRPQPQRVDVAAAPAGDRRVVRDGEHPLGRDTRGRARCRPIAADIFDAAAEADGIFGFRPLELPRVAEREPVLRQLVLPAVADLLQEQAVLVADAVAVGRNAERRHAVHEAGGEPPRPPLPSAASGSSLRSWSRSTPRLASAARAVSSRRRLISESNSRRPIRNSIER